MEQYERIQLMNEILNRKRSKQTKWRFVFLGVVLLGAILAGYFGLLLPLDPIQGG